MKLLVTGGAGFIGSAFVRMVLASGAHTVVNLDKLTYAGNLENLTAVAGDIGQFGGESHVGRSILSPAPVFETNLRGTFTMLEGARLHAKSARFLHVSTDEVYGSIDSPYEAHEQYPLKASSPYSASKA